MNTWIESSYARLLIDNHITEDDASHMSRFDPHAYVEKVKLSGVDAAMVYSCCHNGNCYYPTRVGHMHANLHGRDIFGETITQLREAGITPIAYYTTVYHNHSAKTHPAWRMQEAAVRLREKAMTDDQTTMERIPSRLPVAWVDGCDAEVFTPLIMD